MRRLLVCVWLCAWSVSGCATTSLSPPLPTSSSQKSNLTPGMVKSTIVEGQTTQTEILSVFGAPNIVTVDRSGREVWTYDVQSIASAAGAASVSGGVVTGAGGVIGTVPIAGVGGLSGSRSVAAGQVSSATFTLMVSFGQNGVVEEYRMQSTQF